MKIISVFSLDIEELAKQPIDLVICASGYETRSSTHAKLLKTIAERHICIAFSENISAGARAINDKRYRNLGYSMYDLSGHSIDDAEKLFQQEIEPLIHNAHELTIAIDISSMTRAWYGAFIKTLCGLSYPIIINALFIYTPASFFKVKKPYPPNEVVGPVKGFVGLELPEKPVALIVGLGQDSGRAIGIKEALDPILTIAFNPNPGTDKRFLKQAPPPGAARPD